MGAFLLLVNLILAAVNFTQPLWVDSSPVYPPLIGVLLLGPLNLWAALLIWRAL
jgi:hypothetical protein